MTTPIDYAALRVQLELRLRAVRTAAKGQELSDAQAADLALLERAVDEGTQELLLAAAKIVGVIEAPAVAEAAPEVSSAPELEAPADESASGKR